ncbi:TIGR01459 family HAD-type hydrolase [Labrys monachus]|uniref:HAD superfamily hydrolase (TIGR01459 family) n=1 Tax=Labrys monachus TaxID=217067 RepID=A0ABU0FKT6_9HYPH|nr:TIGR01459 family HAD-type hydrolase [Labrys monachus]MDQ0394967.1 HAD superfamily hydrolase (TIGR01459 family) [Labrys monachus]
MPQTPRLLSGLRDIAPAYDLVFCDIWGVIHNGRAVFPGVAEALAAYRKGGGTVVLVSNAPRPAESVVPQLDGLGLPRSTWDAIVTSGDVTRSHIGAVAAQKIFHLGPDRDRPLFHGFDIAFAGPADAEIVVCTGLFDDTTETPETYRPMLEALLARKVPMICANPDLVVDRGGIMIYCAGAIAEAYRAIGGEAIICGKPFKPIYDAAFAVAATIRGGPTPPERTLAIGDSVRTDLTGAAAIGCGALFIASGIHALEAGHGDGAVDPVALAAFLRDKGVVPDAVMPRLIW